MRVSNNSESLKISYSGNWLRLGWGAFADSVTDSGIPTLVTVSSGGSPCILELRVPIKG